ncbi:hypothetical protein [Petroclostridium sp. X23]|uniref:hypothetical protein n=1 Tax=Petroclostridium sp. X23 TaxID=3045146 RepID=UPI0024AC96F3|nr:hypothetical protein [Petroclostridium sp. X23]WHH60199.1 hypothetical protein QKW49_05555 [Petroclostridium sp. X23]
MIKRLLASSILFIFLIYNSVYALDFSYSASIENMGDKKYKAVRLTSEIYNQIQEDMADLAIYDNNEPIPYFINSFTENEIETKKIYEMKLINSFVKDEHFYYDYAVQKPQNEDVTATSIEMQIDKEDFAKKVEIYGGYDNIHWEKIQDDILYNVGGSKKLEITFDGVKKYTYYRFKISNNLEEVSFSSVKVKYNTILQKKEYFTNTISPAFTIEEKENTTVIKVRSIKNLKLSSITLNTDSIFKRNVAFAGSASKMLYNLEFENTQYRDLTIPLGICRITSDTAEIVIDNQDDKPIKVLGIEIKYLVDELIFESSESNEYILKFGNSEIQSPKRYDISNYREHIVNEGYDVLRLKEIKAESSAVPIKIHYDYKLIFNIVISVVAVVMGIVVFLKLKG